MKKLSLLLLLILVISCKSKQLTAENKEAVRFEKIDLKDVNALKKDRATDLGKRLLETCNTSVFKAFNKNEATDKVIKNATVDRISKACHIINQRNGKFIAIQLIDVTHDIETDDLIFRYKIEYQKSILNESCMLLSIRKTKYLPCLPKNYPKSLCKFISKF